MENSLNVDQIMQYLPHRFPFLLIDRVNTYVPGESLSAIKNVSVNEPFFPGHFPHFPVMPGVLMIEALAQACAILVGVSDSEPSEEKKEMLLIGVDNAKFTRMVRPGDQLSLRVSILNSKRQLFKFATEALVDEEKVCSAVIKGVYQVI